MAISSMSSRRTSLSVRKMQRPTRPKPLMATFVGMTVSRVLRRGAPQTSRTHDATPQSGSTVSRSTRANMHAMMLKRFGAQLEWTELPDRAPAPGEIRVAVAACGVCRTDLHVVDRELAAPRVPIIPDTRSSAASTPSAPASKACASVNALACRGSDIPAAPAAIARREARTCAIRPALRATRATAATQPRPSPTRATHSRSATMAAT
jgi:hypothetical protein